MLLLSFFSGFFFLAGKSVHMIYIVLRITFGEF